MVFASVYKVYVGFSSWRFTSDLGDAFVDGHINTPPHFNRYLSDPQLTDVLKELITASSRHERTGTSHDGAQQSQHRSTRRRIVDHPARG